MRDYMNVCEAEVINFQDRLSDLSRAPISSTVPKDLKRKRDLQKRSTSKLQDISAIEDKERKQIDDKVTDLYVRDFWKSYMVTALWSSTDQTNDEPFDYRYTIQNISAHSMHDMLQTCEKFIDAAYMQLGELIYEIPASQMGHDFWLSQNHHGAGFWDSTMPKNIGDKLHKISQNFPEAMIFLGDDGNLHQERA